jgi:minichromosome maintenance protein 10
MNLNGSGGEEDEDEDEETLQLKLQEIQARLKLKALQKKTKQSSDPEGDIARTSSAPLTRTNSAVASRTQSRTPGLREERLQRSKSQTNVHVPVSPVRRVQPIELARSPQRVLLGIDKGLKASEVSLKRAPSLRKTQEADVHNARLTGPFLQRPASQFSARPSEATSTSGEDRPKSFSERLALIRAQETERQEKDLRIKKSRSMAFDIDHKKMQSFRENAVELPFAPQRAPEFTREEVLDSYNSHGNNAAVSKLTPNSTSKNKSNTGDATTVSNGSDSRAYMKRPARKKSKPADVSESEASQFEPYSSVHLSKRIVPHGELTRILAGKKTFVIPDLLRTVNAPDFSGPDIEQDLVLFAIVASKSEPRSHQQNSKNENRGKYMILELTDLKWELSLFLFDSAFDRFWKLTPGTIIAILNPVIMAPPRGKTDTGKFSLALNSDADMILEIGSARDLGFCKSIKKDGKTCDAWVDQRHTEFCDYHVNLTLEKTHSKRMEVNTMTFGRGRGYGARKYNSQDVTGLLDRRRQIEEEKNTRYDRESHSQIYIGRRTTASLLDDTGHEPNVFQRGSTKEERITRRLVAEEKERELRKKLGDLGAGLGADYIRRKDSTPQLDPSNSLSMAEEPIHDAAALGLLGGKAKDVQLSPIKRKRAHTSSSSAAMGWGGNLTKELGRMKNGESLQPVRKKTRFVTEKGIREAGRESFGGEMAITAASLDDDDDDLDIVRE